MKIKVFKSGKLLKEYDIQKDTFVLGRTESNDICIPEDSVSRKHVEFEVKDKDTLTFSKKAKFAMVTKDGEDIEKGELKDGESISISGLTIMFDAKAEGTEPEKPKAAGSDFDFFTMSIESENHKEELMVPEPEEQQEGIIESSDKDKEEKVKTVNKKKEEKIEKEEEKTTEPKSKVQKDEKPVVSDATVVGPGYLLYQLIVISGPHKDKVFTITKDIMIAGRGKKVEIPLIDDLASREHARFYRQGVDYYVVDLDSANGTKVNGKKIVEPVLLTSGDIVEIGSSILRFMVVNPQIQNVHGIKDLASSRDAKQGPVEKIIPMPSDAQIKKMEKSYGFEQDQNKKQKPRILLPIVLVIAVIIIGAVFLLGKGDKGKTTTSANNNNTPVVTGPVEGEEAIPEVKCEEQGSFCQQPLAVQKELQAQYEVGKKLLLNFQFELAEDRAQQILAKVPDWDKAKELLNVASSEKDKLLAQKKEEEDTEIRKALEKKVSAYLQQAEALMRQEKYDQVKELISKIFEIDPNNEGGKSLADKIEAIEAKRKKLAEDREKYLVTLSKYEKILAEGRKYYTQKEYRKTIEALQKCISSTPNEGERIAEIKNECKKLISDSSNLLKQSVTPELSGAMEAYTNGRYKEAIETYNRVLKLDYKNKEAKDGIVKAKESLEEEAREIFSRAAIAESVSDYATACPLYNRVLEMTIPGSKYYNSAAAKAKNRCGTKL